MYKLGKKIESMEKANKNGISPSTSAGPSTQTDSLGAFTVTRMIQLEKAITDIEVLKTEMLVNSNDSSKKLDLTSPNVNKWIESKLESFIKSSMARNFVREIVTCKLDSFQVISVCEFVQKN